MIPLLIILFVFNLLLAMGMKVLANGDMGKRVFSNRWIKVFLLIPPVSIVLSGFVILFGMGWILYYLFETYLSND
jgi:hypothetical protein